MATEPATNWQIFMPIPNATVELDVEANANFDPMRQLPWYGPTMPRALHDDLEILSIDGSVAAALGDVDPISLDTVSASNGLIRYVASLERALAPGGWLAPAGDDPIESAAVAISRGLLLAQIANLPDSAFPVLVSDYQKANAPTEALNERRKFLKSALVPVLERIFHAHKPSLETQTALAALVLQPVRDTRKSLDAALEALVNMSKDRASELIKAATPVLGVEPNQDLLSANAGEDALTTAIIGASEAIAALDNSLTANQARRCVLLKTMEQHSNHSIPPMTLLPGIVDACKL